MFFCYSVYSITYINWYLWICALPDLHSITMMSSCIRKQFTTFACLTTFLTLNGANYTFFEMQLHLEKSSKSTADIGIWTPTLFLTRLSFYGLGLIAHQTGQATTFEIINQGPFKMISKLSLSNDSEQINIASWLRNLWEMRHIS